MDNEKLLKALGRLSVETGSPACSVCEVCGDCDMCVAFGQLDRCQMCTRYYEPGSLAD